MKFEIKNRFTGDVQIVADIECAEDTPFSIKMGLAVKWAIKSEADLSEANLSWANLSKANLSEANLSEANLSWANLSKANLSEADLSEANLSEANLSKANLSKANLSEADLSEANLSKADLSEADLSEANLSEANLSKANLSKANLSKANLSEANLSWAKQDFIAEVLRLPNELEGLREYIVQGKIDGSTYSGECACLAGTFAKIKGISDYKGSDIVNGCTYHADSRSPRERFFLAIRPGDTPENNGAAKIALAWLDEAIQVRDNIRGSDHHRQGGEKR